MYQLSTFYPDVIENDYSIILNKQIKESRDGVLYRYMSSYKILNRVITPDNLTFVCHILKKFVDNSYLNRHNIQILIELSFMGERKMCLLINKDIIKCCDSFNPYHLHKLSLKLD